MPNPKSMIQISLFHQSEILPSQQVKRAVPWTKTFGPQFSVQTLSIYVRSIFYRNNGSELLIQFWSKILGPNLGPKQMSNKKCFSRKSIHGIILKGHMGHIICSRWSNLVKLALNHI